MGLNGRRVKHKTNLPLGKKNTIPVQSGRCFDLAQTKIKAVKKLGIGPVYENVPRTINQWGADIFILLADG